MAIRLEPRSVEWAVGLKVAFRLGPALPTAAIGGDGLVIGVGGAGQTIAISSGTRRAMAGLETTGDAHGNAPQGHLATVSQSSRSVTAPSKLPLGTPCG